MIDMGMAGFDVHNCTGARRSVPGIVGQRCYSVSRSTMISPPPSRLLVSSARFDPVFAEHLHNDELRIEHLSLDGYGR